MKKPKKKDLKFFAPPVPEKPKRVNNDHVKGLFHYFGYEPTSISINGLMQLRHKHLEGNLCIFGPYEGVLCRVTFCDPGSGTFVMGSISARPKTWSALFTAVRNHTRRLIAMRDAQYKPKAA